MCHNFSQVKDQIAVLTTNFSRDTALSHFLVYLISMFGFSAIGYTIYRFSISVTKPITQLTHHTKNYKSAKGLEEKEKVINEIKQDEMFRITKLKLKKEQLDKGDFDIKVNRRETINKKKKTDSFVKKKTKVLQDHQ